MLYLLSGMRMPCPTCAQVLLPIPVSVRCQLSRGAIPTTFPEAAPPRSCPQLITMLSFCRSTYISPRSVITCLLAVFLLKDQGHLCLVTTVSWPLGQCPAQSRCSLMCRLYKSGGRQCSIPEWALHTTLDSQWSGPGDSLPWTSCF